MAHWLGCHRRAFEWFAAVPARVIIDNAKCAIVKACIRDPEVQRSMPIAPKATVSRSTHAHPTIRRRKALSNRASNT
ncbi:MAG: hypothetical protein IPJ50_06220 [Betaproteobacteria bacterium]|nr:hypothetical protein [Betaproteobacteria bacterium]